MTFQKMHPRSLRRGSSSFVTTIAVIGLLAGPLLSSSAVAAEVAPLPSATTASEILHGQEVLGTDRFIVTFSEQTTSSARSAIYDKVEHTSAIVAGEVEGTENGAITIETNDILSASEMVHFTEALESQPTVISVEPDTLMQIASTPNDPLYPNQWALGNTSGGARIAETWDRAAGGLGQVIAVIDTGITAHSDLAANILPGYDMISTASLSRDGDGRDADPQDEGDYREAGDCGSSSIKSSSWHGTHVAGIIAAVSDNGQGIAGAAPGAKVLPIRALGNCGGYSSDIADAIIWASGGSVTGVPDNANPARTINLSIGVTGVCEAVIQEAVNSAYSRGSLVFAAAGNANVDAGSISPANCDNVVSVGATNRYGAKASYSNYGSSVDISAPGGDINGGIVSTMNTGKTSPETESHSYVQGTSMAAPHAASVSALMLSANPLLAPSEVAATMKSTARAIQGACAEGCGSGIVDAAAAVESHQPTQESLEFTSVPPTISGTVKVGHTLATDPGDWGTQGTEFSYQWNLSGEAIAGATKNTYILPASAVGHSLTVTVTGSKSGYSPRTETSSKTTAVTKGSLTTGTPVVSGTTKVGKRLTVNPGTWSPAPVAITYEWYRDGVRISGATGNSYLLTAEDRGKRIVVHVIGRKTGYIAVYRKSTPTSAIAYGDLKGDFPTVTGEAKAGSKLTVNPGLWTPGVTVSYQWYRDGVIVAGATGKYFTLTDEDRGHKIKVRSLGKKPGYVSRAYYSYSTLRVA